MTSIVNFLKVFPREKQNLPVNIYFQKIINIHFNEKNLWTIIFFCWRIPLPFQKIKHMQINHRLNEMNCLRYFVISVTLPLYFITLRILTLFFSPRLWRICHACSGICFGAFQIPALSESPQNLLINQFHGMIDFKTTASWVKLPTHLFFFSQNP